MICPNAHLTHTYLVSVAEQLQRSLMPLTHPDFWDQLMSFQVCDSVMKLQVSFTVRVQTGLQSLQFAFSADVIVNMLWPVAALSCW